MADSITQFQKIHPSLGNYWRSIILFGKNTASYKFALAKALLACSNTEDSHVPLDKLASLFADNMCQHLLTAPKQLTGPESLFIDTCNRFIRGEVSRQTLVDITLKKGFRWVLDAFHNVNHDKPVQFYSFSRRDKQLVLRDEFFRLCEENDIDMFSSEAEARWNLVETAWELKLSTSVLQVQYDDKGQRLFVQADALRRKDISSARDSLSGYQKGKCFYCFDDISIQSGDAKLCDVDHFLPFSLIQDPQFPNVNINGLWNLVLACPRCNRASEKSDKIPDIAYLDRLRRRNEFLISSEDPLRGPLMKQTGTTESARFKFLQRMYGFAKCSRIEEWKTEPRGEEIF